jgi:hypothetical protein
LFITKRNKTNNLSHLFIRVSGKKIFVVTTWP